MKITAIVASIILYTLLTFALILQGCGKEKKEAVNQAAETTQVASGVITFAIGKAEVKIKGAQDWTLARVGMKLNAGDEIRTDDCSSTDIRLTSNTAVRIKENTHISISKLFSMGKYSKADMDLSAGKVFMFMKKMGTDSSSVSIQTPNAVAAIRGTQFTLEYTPVKTTRISVLEGDITVINRGNLADRFHITENEKVEIFHLGVRDSVSTLDEEKAEELKELALISFSEEQSLKLREGEQDLLTALEIYKKHFDYYPPHLKELYQKAIIDKKFLIDKWDSDYIYSATNGGAGFNLRSIGADKIENTPDDIVINR